MANNDAVNDDDDDDDGIAAPVAAAVVCDDDDDGCKNPKSMSPKPVARAHDNKNKQNDSIMQSTSQLLARTHCRSLSTAPAT